MDNVEVFIAELVELCKRHEVRMFARRDSERNYISFEIGPETGPERAIWVDLIRVSSEGAVRIR
jgi:hypothetical protein